MESLGRHLVFSAPPSAITWIRSLKNTTNERRNSNKRRKEESNPEPPESAGNSSSPAEATRGVRRGNL
ncbi:hypothetical protein AGIG_G21992 [Arapaima gigas]